jgi:hypothetical protein
LLKGVEGMLLTLIDIAIGLVAAIGLTRFLSDLLYEVSAIDPLIYGVYGVADRHCTVGLLGSGAAGDENRPAGRVAV